MSGLTVVILCFSVLGAVGYVFKDKWGLGAEFERGFQLLGVMMLSMTGMIVISPLIADLISPVFDMVYRYLRIDPSIIPSSLFANDMGGAPLSLEVAKNSAVGNFNAFVVSSMMGCTISFTIPVGMKMTDSKGQRQLMLGLLCGVATVPIGCFAAGLFCNLSLSVLITDLLPIIILAALIILGLLFLPEVCIKIFKGIGFFIGGLVIVGLMLGIVNFLNEGDLIKGIATVEEGAMVCVNAAIVMSGMFPLIKIASIILKKPLGLLGRGLKINETATAGLFSSLATSMIAFGVINKMDPKGKMLNSAFAVSGAFCFAGHLAFTMAYNKAYILPMIIGKLTAGLLAVVLANMLYSKFNSNLEET